MGWLCNLHFLSTDIEKVKGRLRLKADAVPVRFNTPNITGLDRILDNIAVDEIANSCNNCNDLSLELKDLKQMLLEIKMNTDIQLQMKNQQIEKMKIKCNDLTLKNNGLKEQNVFLERMLKNHEIQIKNLREMFNKNVNFCI